MRPAVPAPQQVAPAPRFIMPSRQLAANSLNRMAVPIPQYHQPAALSSHEAESDAEMEHHKPAPKHKKKKSKHHKKSHKKMRKHRRSHKKGGRRHHGQHGLTLTESAVTIQKKVHLDKKDKSKVNATKIAEDKAKA